MITIANAKALVQSHSLGNTPMAGTSKESHCLVVGRIARKIAEQLHSRGHDIDPETTEIKGILHDIGDNWERGNQHPIVGYKFLKNLGLPEDIAGTCLKHSFIGGEPNCSADGILIRDDGSVAKSQIIPYKDDPQSHADREFLLDYLRTHPYTLCDKVINLCDLMVTDRVVGLDSRLQELLTKKSRNPDFVPNPAHTPAAQALQVEIEKLMRCKITDLLPEITAFQCQCR